MLRTLTACLMAGSLAFAPVANACTGIRLTAKDGNVVAGRTMEFGVPVDWMITVTPPGTEVTGQMPDGTDGLSFKTKYGIVGMTGFDQLAYVDAINEEGLYVGLFYFPGYASYQDLTDENRGKALAPQQYALWLLASFGTVEEIKSHFNDVAIVPTVIQQLGIPAPMHVRVVDKSGQSVVIEPTDKTLKIFDNPLGVITNSPTFDWHMTNLSNYVNLSVVNVPPVKIDGMELASAGQGSGMHGLPGDFTPPSRFVRAAVFSQSVLPVDNGREALDQAFHILNNFDIPYGAVRDANDGKPAPDYTQWTAVADTRTPTWTVRMYHDQQLRSINVADALKAAGGKIKQIDPGQWTQPLTDISADFK